MNIYKQEISGLFKKTIIWSVSITALLIFYIAVYPGFAKDADQFKELLNNYPPAVLNALGATIDIVTSFNGFYSFCFVYANLFAAIQAMTFGVSVLSKESARKTCDFIFSKPVSRLNILISKLLAVITCLFITNIIVVSATSIGAFLVTKEDFNFEVFLLISLTMIITQIIFASLGFFCAALSRKIKSPATVSIGVVMAFFALELIVNIIGEDKLKYISFLSYFKGDYIIKNEQYELSMVMCAAIAVAFFVSTALIYYKKKDIHST